MASNIITTNHNDQVEISNKYVNESVEDGIVIFGIVKSTENDTCILTWKALLIAMILEYLNTKGRVLRMTFYHLISSLGLFYELGKYKILAGQAKAESWQLWLTVEENSWQLRLTVSTICDIQDSQLDQLGESGNVTSISSGLLNETWVS